MVGLSGGAVKLPSLVCGGVMLCLLDIDADLIAHRFLTEVLEFPFGKFLLFTC